jgi:signal transduction histidine kinase
MSLYSRIFFPFVLSLMLGGAVAWWLATSLTTATLHGRLDDQLARAAAQLATGRLPLSEELTGRLGRLLGAEIVLVPAARGAPIAGMSDLGEAIRRLWAGSPLGGRARLHVGRTLYSVALQPVSPAVDQRFSAVAAAMPLTEVQRAARRVAALLGIAGLAGTLLLAWVAHLVARDITRPLGDLAGLAGRLATGDLGARVEIRGARELSQLGSAIDDMAARLARYQTEIAERNRLSALGEMASRIAHEVRNPLTAIKLRVELLAETAQDAGDQQSLAHILNEINRLELVVSATLSLASRSESRFVPTDLNGVVDAVTDLMRPQLAHRQIRLECRLHPVAQARLDADRLKQILLNLINNAADALPQGGIVRVTTEQATAEAELALSVEDSGPGVAAAQCAGLFERSASAKPHGLGVGLLISREIAELHGGSIGVERSAALGGARFVLRLPIGEPATPPAAAEAKGHE